MLVEEAISYVNNQVNPSKNEEFGPPDFANSGNRESNNEILSKSEEEINLDKIEADMDEHANKIYLDGAVNVKNPPEKDGFVVTVRASIPAIASVFLILGSFYS